MRKSQIDNAIIKKDDEKQDYGFWKIDGDRKSVV